MPNGMDFLPGLRDRKNYALVYKHALPISGGHEKEKYVTNIFSIRTLSKY
jgi:hypothetical protein